jgi:hypothetical protein
MAWIHIRIQQLKLCNADPFGSGSATLCSENGVNSTKNMSKAASGKLVNGKILSWP